MNDYGIILFSTSTYAMQAEAVLTKARLAVRLIPTPRELSSDCGVSLRFDWGQCELVSQMLQQAGVETAGIHPLPGK